MRLSSLIYRSLLSLTALFCVSRFCVALCCVDWVFGECPSKLRISCTRRLIFVQEIPNKNTFLGYLVKHSKTFIILTKTPELLIASLFDVTAFAAGYDGLHSFKRK
jgi:hypothetical protein